MQHRSRGPRPTYFTDVQLDKFHVMLMTLVQEVGVLRERLDTIERLLERGEIVSSDDIENYVPDEQVAAERHEWRSAYVERVLRVVFEEADQLKSRGERFERVEDVVEAVSAS